MSIHRRAAKRDDGERSIVSALRRVGALVWPISAEGIPDLLIGYRGRFMLLEIKQPLGPNGGDSNDGQHLQPAQARFFEEAQIGELPAFVVRSPEQALEAIGCKLVLPGTR